MTDDRPDVLPGFRKAYQTALPIEVEKAKAIQAIGVRHGFVAPAVLAVDPAASVVTYERFDDLVPLRRHYLDFMTGQRSDDVLIRPFEAAGRALAAIHRELTLSSRTPWVPPATFDDRRGMALSSELEATPHAWLHCDYGFGNTQTRNGSAMDLVVIDPSPNRYLTTATDTYGSIYLDLGLFLACLQGLVPARYYPRLRWGRERALRDSFLAGYGAVAAESLHRNLLERATHDVAVAYCRHRFRRRRLASLAALALYHRPNAAW